MYLAGYLICFLCGNEKENVLIVEISNNWTFFCFLMVLKQVKVKKCIYYELRMILMLCLCIDVLVGDMKTLNV